MDRTAAPVETLDAAESPVRPEFEGRAGRGRVGLNRFRDARGRRHVWRSATAIDKLSRPERNRNVVFRPGKPRDRVVAKVGAHRARLRLDTGVVKLPRTG